MAVQMKRALTIEQAREADLTNRRAFLQRALRDCAAPA